MTQVTQSGFDLLWYLTDSSIKCCKNNAKASFKNLNALCSEKKHGNEYNSSGCTCHTMNRFLSFEVHVLWPCWMFRDLRVACAQNSMSRRSLFDCITFRTHIRCVCQLCIFSHYEPNQPVEYYTTTKADSTRLSSWIPCTQLAQ